jgi:sulfite exporter TauE/SafE
VIDELTLASAFMIGLLGSTHCIGMCGGIVGALTMGGAAEKLQRFPRHKWTRNIAGILLIAFGAMILNKALGGGHMGGGHMGGGHQHNMKQGVNQYDLSRYLPVTIAECCEQCGGFLREY